MFLLDALNITLDIVDGGGGGGNPYSILTRKKKTKNSEPQAKRPRFLVLLPCIGCETLNKSFYISELSHL